MSPGTAEDGHGGVASHRHSTDRDGATAISFFGGVRAACEFGRDHFATAAPPCLYFTHR